MKASATTYNTAKAKYHENKIWTYEHYITYFWETDR